MHQKVLAAPFVDTRAADLGWSLDPAVPVGPPLAVLPLRLPIGSLELQLLGASHRAVLRRPVDGASPDQVALDEEVVLVETVACLPGAAPALPRSARHRTPAGLAYAFSSSVTVPGPGAFPAAVDAVLAGLPEPSLVGRFPGEPLALTALAADTDGTGLRWRTWHVYPQTFEIVETRSEVQVGEALWTADGAEQTVGAGSGGGTGRPRTAGSDRLLVR